MVFQKISPEGLSTATQFAGDVVNKIADLFSGLNIAQTDASNKPVINTETMFYSSTLRILDNNQSHEFYFDTSGANITEHKAIIIPQLTAASDTIAFINQAQTLSNKILSSPTLSGTIAGTSVFGGQVSIYPNSAVPLVVGRDQNSSNFAIDLAQDNSAGTVKTMASIQVDVTTFTAGSETADLRLRTIRSGTLTTNLVLGATTLDFPGSGTGRFVLSTSGLTSTRTFTFPNSSGTLLTLEAQNTFTNFMKIRIDTTFPLILHRNSAGTCALQLNANNSSGTEVEYGALFSSVISSTAGAHSSSITIRAANAGASANAFVGNPSAGTATLLGNIVLSNSGLASARTFTFPDLNGTIMTLEKNQTITGIQTWKAANTVSKAAQSSVAETIQTWTIDDSAATSKIEFLNASSTNAVFSPWIRAYNMDNTNPALYFYGYIGNALDTGSEAGIRFDVRKADNTALATRPLFSFRSAGTEIFQINQTSFLFGLKHLSNINTITVNTTAAASTAEQLQEWKVSDASSSVKIRNQSATDGIFIPQIFSYNADTAANNGLRIISECNASQADISSNQGVFVFDSRKVGSIAFTARPIYDFQSAGTSVFKIDGNGLVIQTITAQSGVAESIQTWKISDSSSDALWLNSATSVNAKFAPRFQSYQATDAALASFSIMATVDPTIDSGTVPVLSIDSRRSGGAALTTRPLLGIYANNTLTLTMNPKGDLFNNVIAQASVAETVAEFSITDTSSYLRIYNGSTTDARFMPCLRGRQVDDSALSGLFLEGRIEAAHDTGTVPVTVIQSTRQDSAKITARPLLEFRNAGTAFLKVNPYGDLLTTVIAQAATAEVMQEWKVSDTANGSKIQISNNSATDAVLSPMFRGYGLDISTGAALAIRGYIGNSLDTGTTPAMLFRVEKLDTTAVATRPLFDFVNAGTSLFRINATNLDFNKIHPINTRGLAVLPVAESNDSRRFGMVDSPTCTGVGHFASSVFATHGTHAVSSESTNGSRTAISTGVTINTDAGWRANTTHFARRNYNPVWTTKFDLAQTTDIVFYFGYSGSGTSPSGNDPLSGLSGYLFGMNPALNATNWIIVHNDAAGASNVIDTGVAFATGITSIVIEADITLGWCYSINNSAFSSWLTTEMPAANHSLAAHFNMRNTTGADKTVYHYATGFQSKK
jgi:hypothetical protein